MADENLELPTPEQLAFYDASFAADAAVMITGALKSKMSPDALFDLISKLLEQSYPDATLKSRQQRLLQNLEAYRNITF